MFCVCESLVLYIYSAQSRLQVSVAARPLRPTPDRHQVTQAHPPSQQGHSGLGATVTQCGAHCLVSICYLTVSTHYNSGALIPECNGLLQFKEVINGPSVPHSIPAVSPTN